MSEPARMAKWAEKTESISRQINEAEESMGQLKDKISFILLVPPPTQAKEPSDMPPGLQDRVDEMVLGGGPDNSALSAKLDVVLKQMASLNEAITKLCDGVDI